MVSKPQPSTLLFINKDQQSDSLSNNKGDKSTSIQRHAQRWRAQRLRERRAEALRKSSAAIRVAGSGWQSGGHESQEQRPANSAQKPSKSEDDEKVKELASAMKSEVGLSVVEPVFWYLRHEEDYKILTANFSEGDCIDPFNCTALPTDHEIQSILQYYLKFSIPATYSAEQLPKDHPKSSLSMIHRHAPAVKKGVNGALFNKMHMYALLTATAGRMKYVSRVRLDRHNSAELFMEQAIQHLRVYLKSHKDAVVDKQVILDVFFLCVCEWYLQNYSAALTHLSAVGHMMKSLDLSSKFDQYIEETARYNDVFLSVETATPPIFSLTWDTPALAPTR